MKKQDLRIIRTDRRIRETFLVLIDEIGFDAVTIKLLTERAEVNRGHSIIITRINTNCSNG
ncbi:hypothetical protein OVA29_10240 [Exiguobacterium sp. SL14]|nr:hypothetical protein [Exiguobacterium sp. SL14]MCY1691000.1 hypothetical protein [Exiguobacterium sp. SL14]